MTPQELKNSILQLAIQGKLVEQRPEEGTAAELLRDILTQRRREAECAEVGRDYRARRNGRAVAPRPPIPDDEKPFDIPESWEWVRLGEVLRVIGGVSYDKKDVAKTGFRILRGGNIQNMKVILAEDDVFLPAQYEDDDKLVRVGDILIVASTGSKAVIGKGGYVDRVLHNTMIGAFLRICRPSSFELADYLRIIFESDFYRKHIRVLAQGTNINNVKESYITQFAIPLPPLAEQKRIVAKIEELLPLIDRYEKAWSKLEDFNRRFPVDMQKSVLQMAIQGKLVDQRPEEGTAAELLEKIARHGTHKTAGTHGTKSRAAHRASFVSSVSSVSDVPVVSPIPDEEKPFDIPESWEWVRLSDLMTTISTGPFGSMLHKADYIENGIPLVNPANIVGGRIIPSQKMMVSEETRERLAGYILHEGMIVMGRRGEMGRCAVVSREEDGWLCGTGSFFLEPDKNIFVEYISRLFSTPYAKLYLGGESVGTTMSNLNHTILRNMLIPLPPLAEQKRIVAKLEEILPLCERLK